MARKNPPCDECGQVPRYSIIDAYRYEDSGLDNVYLQDVEAITCECGSRVVIRAVPTLLRIITTCFAYKPGRLRGKEIRFIRHVIGSQSKEFAEVISVTPEHLSRLENSNKPISPPLDKLVRARIILDLVTVHKELARGFDLRRFQEVVSKTIPEKNHLSLYVKYQGPYIGAEEDGQIQFEFKKAA